MPCAKRHLRRAAQCSFRAASLRSRLCMSPEACAGEHPCLRAAAAQQLPVRSTSASNRRLQAFEAGGHLQHVPSLHHMHPCVCRRGQKCPAWSAWTWQAAARSRQKPRCALSASHPSQGPPRRGAASASCASRSAMCTRLRVWGCVCMGVCRAPHAGGRPALPVPHAAQCARACVCGVACVVCCAALHAC